MACLKILLYIFLLSDHGVGIQSIYYAFEFYTIENDLPMLYVIFNDRKNITHDKQYFYLRENQQTFITAFDIYNTINHLLYGDKYKNIYIILQMKILHRNHLSE